MTLEDYRIQCGWSKTELARRANIDFNTLNKAYQGKPVAISTANKIASAFSQQLGRTIYVNEIEGLNVNL
jgi:DNA-binding XRE family transcriptional regulator